jgi:hypothetical protein
MGLRQVEREILHQAKAATGRPHLRQTDIVNWSINPLWACAGESIYYLRGVCVYATIRDGGK